ncbi:hypothetical protein NDA16_003557 [Ustilago loliicola]|nr:hypothetical protein NDA16_003557 [Ustilago loliicola]
MPPKPTPHPNSAATSAVPERLKHTSQPNVSVPDIPPDAVAQRLEAQASALVADAIKATYEVAQRMYPQLSGVQGPQSARENTILRHHFAQRYSVAWRVYQSNRILDDDVRGKYPEWFCELLKRVDDRNAQHLESSRAYIAVPF